MGLFKGAYKWIDDRFGVTSLLNATARHPVPKTNFWYVFGSATLVAFIVQVVTGVALAFAYVPAPNSAYESLEFITHAAVLGSVVRGIHYWGASAMVVLIGCHMAHVFLTGSYKFPREANWLTGAVLFLCTAGMAFTGQLLRWNQDAYWAIHVMASMVGRVPIVGETLVDILLAGQTVGGATLTRFYATHVFLLPAVMFVVIGVHLYLVLRHGISEPPKVGEPVDPQTYRQRYRDLLRREAVPFWPDAVWLDVVFALVVGSVVLLLAIYPGPADLGKPVNPAVVETYPQPDWYFIWVFALQALIPPTAETYVIIGLPTAIVIALFLLPLLAPSGERHPRRRPWAVAVTVVIVLPIALLIRTGYQAPWSPEFQPGPLPESVTQPLSGPAARGALLYEVKACINCHKIAGVGGERGPDLSAVGSRLSHDQLTWRILNGGRNMPAYGTILTPEELEALVAFLETQKGQAIEAALERVISQ